VRAGNGSVRDDKIISKAATEEIVARLEIDRPGIWSTWANYQSRHTRFDSCNARIIAQ
jgi:hypothetical protein